MKKSFSSILLLSFSLAFTILPCFGTRSKKNRNRNKNYAHVNQPAPEQKFGDEIELLFNDKIEEDPKQQAYDTPHANWITHTLKNSHPIDNMSEFNIHLQLAHFEMVLQNDADALDDYYEDISEFIVLHNIPVTTDEQKTPIINALYKNIEKINKEKSLIKLLDWKTENNAQPDAEKQSKLNQLLESQKSNTITQLETQCHDIIEKYKTKKQKTNALVAQEISEKEEALIQYTQMINKNIQKINKAGKEFTENSKKQSTEAIHELIKNTFITLKALKDLQQKNMLPAQIDDNEEKEENMLPAEIVKFLDEKNEKNLTLQ